MCVGVYVDYYWKTTSVILCYMERLHYPTNEVLELGEILS